MRMFLLGSFFGVFAGMFVAGLCLAARDQRAMKDVDAEDTRAAHP